MKKPRISPTDDFTPADVLIIIKLGKLLCDMRSRLLT